MRYREFTTAIVRAAVCSLLGLATSHAQSAKPAPSTEPPPAMVEQPCPPALELPAGARRLLVELFVEPRKLTPQDYGRLDSNAEFKAFSAASGRRGSGDWAGLCRFHAADVSVRADRVHPGVVFMGDSITENWGMADPDLFTHGVLNRGISGQTSEQMLVRFQADVVSLHPQTVLILAGTNDIAGNTGPNSPEDFENDIVSMVQIARANHIEPVLCSIPPTAGFSWRPGVDPRPWIRKLNAWLRDYATHGHLQFLDFYPLLAGPSGEFRADLSNDGVHPNRAGYRLMRAEAEKGILQPDIRDKHGRGTP